MRRSALLVASLAFALVTAGCVSGWAFPGRSSGDETPALRATIVLPEEAAVGEEVRLEAVVEGDAPEKLFYFWIFGDGAEARGDDLRVVERTYAEGGSYEVQLLVLDGAGAEGAAEAVLPVNQAFRFEGSVSSGVAGGVGRGDFSAAVPVQENVGRVTADLALDRGNGPHAGVLPGTSAVTVRLLFPPNDREGGDDVLAEQRVDVPPEGTRVNLTVPGSALVAAGDVVFEVVAEEGMARFTADVRVAYAS